MAVSATVLSRPSLPPLLAVEQSIDGRLVSASVVDPRELEEDVWRVQLADAVQG